MPLKAVIFGAIGTLVETSERQRQAFNAAFDQAGLDWNWDKDSYQAMLAITGGQNRIRQYADETGTPLTEEQVVAIHAAKSRIYQQDIQDNGLTLRPGVAELVEKAVAAGVQLAFASTTSQQNVQAIDTALGEASPYRHFAVITNRETVENGKPAPDVYQHVLSELGIATDEAIAIEDTHKSLRSAVAAGITTVATPGDYVQDQDYSAAVAVATPEQLADLDWLRSLLAEPTVA